MSIFTMKKSDFATIPYRKWDDPPIEFTSLVIVPSRKKHESGYNMMSFCAIDHGKPIAMLGGCSDVMHIEGIGGYGEWIENCPKYSKCKSWCIDCLPCGYLHIWCSGYKLKASAGLSDFDVYSVEK